MAIAIRSYNNGSESLLNWRNLLNERTGDRTGVIIRQRGSRFRLRPTDYVLNWGSSEALPENLASVSQDKLINRPESVRSSTNKILALNAMAEAGIPTVEFTTSRLVADGWMANGNVVYARTVLQGHSGEGIVVGSREVLNNVGNINVTSDLPRASLYTKAITGPRREFRVHVFAGVVTNVQLKRRRNGYQEMPEYSEIVRNFHTGWVYTTSNISPNNAAMTAAIDSVRALELTFGAVDVITNGENAWVLEVNTAPGMEGSNATSFVEALIAFTNSRDIQPWNNNNATATPDPEVTEQVPVIEEDATEEPEPAPTLATLGQGTPPELVEAADRVIEIVRAEAPRNPFITPDFRNSEYEDGAVYRVNWRGNEHIMQYNMGIRGFLMFGFNIRILSRELEVIARVV